MNDPMIIAGAIVMVLGGFGAVIVQVINAKAAADERRDAKAYRERMEALANTGDEKNNRIIEQGIAIKTSTDGNLSALTAKLEMALAKIEGLEKVIVTQDKAKDVADNLARAVSKEPRILDEMTEIKENTANTVNAVKDLKGRSNVNSTNS